jgi:excisionase family DNA binding protein
VQASLPGRRDRGDEDNAKSSGPAQGELPGGDRRDSRVRTPYLNGDAAEIDAALRVRPTLSESRGFPYATRSNPWRRRAPAVLTVQEAASVVKLTQWTIYRAIQRGDLVAYKPGGRLRINEKDLDAWLEATRVCPPPSSPKPARMVPPPDLVSPSRRQSDDGTLRARVRAQRRKRSAA